MKYKKLSQKLSFKNVATIFLIGYIYQKKQKKHTEN